MQGYARRVYTIERHRGLQREAEKRFVDLKLRNMVTRLGDGSKGWPEQAPIRSHPGHRAAAGDPAVLVDQLALGGSGRPIGHARGASICPGPRDPDSGAVEREILDRCVSCRSYPKKTRRAKATS